MQASAAGHDHAVELADQPRRHLDLVVAKAHVDQPWAAMLVGRAVLRDGSRTQPAHPALVDLEGDDPGPALAAVLHELHRPLERAEVQVRRGAAFDHHVTQRIDMHQRTAALALDAEHQPPAAFAFEQRADHARQQLGVALDVRQRHPHQTRPLGLQPGEQRVHVFRPGQIGARRAASAGELGGLAAALHGLRFQRHRLVQQAHGFVALGLRAARVVRLRQLGLGLRRNRFVEPRVGTRHQRAGFLVQRAGTLALQQRGFVRRRRQCARVGAGLLGTDAQHSPAFGLRQRMRHFGVAQARQQRVAFFGRACAAARRAERFFGRRAAGSCGSRGFERRHFMRRL